MMPTLKIEANVPLPSNFRQPHRRYPYDDMCPGHSIFVPHKEQLNIRHWGLQNGFRFVKRRVVEDGIPGVRVWRVA